MTTSILYLSSSETSTNMGSCQVRMKAGVHGAQLYSLSMLTVRSRDFLSAFFLRPFPFKRTHILSLLSIQWVEPHTQDILPTAPVQSSIFFLNGWNLLNNYTWKQVRPLAWDFKFAHFSFSGCQALYIFYLSAL